VELCLEVPQVRAGDPWRALCHGTDCKIWFHRYEKIHWKCGWARVELDHQVLATEAPHEHSSASSAAVPSSAVHGSVAAHGSIAAHGSEVAHGSVTVPKPDHPKPKIEHPQAFLAGTKTEIVSEKVEPVDTLLKGLAKFEEKH
jgi:hypothetical protein